MTYQIQIKEELFKQLTIPVQHFLKQISISEKEIIYFLDERCSPTGDVDKDLCQMMTDIVKSGKLSADEKALIKSYFGITYKKVQEDISLDNGSHILKTKYQKHESLNCDESLEKLADITELPQDELQFEIEVALSKIKKYNQEIIEKHDAKINKFDYLKKEYQDLEKKLTANNEKMTDEEYVILEDNFERLKREYCSEIYRVKCDLQQIVYN